MDYASQFRLLKIFCLVSGLLNIISALSWLMITIAGGLASYGLLCLVGFMPLINIVVCAMDFRAYNKLNMLNRRGTFQTLKIASILDIVSIVTFNVLGMIWGIYVLVTINTPQFKNELNERGIY